MNHWRRSVGELQARRRQVTECEQALAALSKVTACFQQMASSLGSNTDGSGLREELAEIRAMAHRIYTGLHRRLIALLTETEQAQEDREQVERLWVLFLSGLETFQKDLRKTSSLQELFPLTQRRDRSALVKTGYSGESEVAARAATVQTPWVCVEDEPCPDLQTQISRMDSLLQEMLQRVNVPVWTVEATQKAWVEVEKEEQDEDETLEDLMQVEVVSQDSVTGCCHHLNCRLSCLLCLLS
ncbi:regulator of G-protein signaling 9-binding protein [Alosa pseudoharengus]|uniref:regulator of G-protein signaling 9-binding protein n=1 Tax=Alosa sapidissima TaxID=34773 RepID=UPI001C094350|nr:regulator of G-protein signaling 9-binding protein [Alosa sapidissima]